MANEQFRGLSKLMPKAAKSEPQAAGKPEMKEPAEKAGQQSGEGGVKVHEIHEHPDGHLETHMHDGSSETHPDLLHMTTHVAHHMAPESKHHHSMHDGFAHQTHGVHEDGHHEGTNEHESSDDAANEMKQFMGGGGEEGGGMAERGAEQEEAPVSMGGM